MNNKIIFFVPIPPPYAGPEIANKILINTQKISKSEQVIFIKSNIREKNNDRGKLDIKGVFKFLSLYVKIVRYFVKNDTKHFYFLISSARLGFYRDIIYIITAKFFNTNVIAHYRGSNMTNFYENLPIYEKKLVRFILLKIDKIILQGYNIKKGFVGFYPENKIFVLPNGINTREYQQNLSYNKDDVFTIFFMGHIWYPKGFYDLILAYKELFNKFGPKIKLIFAGEIISNSSHELDFLSGKSLKYFKENRNEIKHTINSFIDNASKYNAKFVGVVNFDKKVEIFNSTSVFVLPSYTEGFSFACLEALTMGVPVITTNVGAMSELITDSENGFITDVGNYNDLFKKILFLYNNRGEIKKISRKNRIKSRVMYDSEVIANELLRIINYE